MDPEKFRTYTLVVGEGQRQWLITALEQCRLQGYYGARGQERQEIDHLYRCLVDADHTRPNNISGI